jgi:hypothetical protein
VAVVVVAQAHRLLKPLVLVVLVVARLITRVPHLLALELLDKETMAELVLLLVIQALVVAVERVL